MRTHWLPLIGLLAASFPAAADTTLIPLHHLPVAEIERQLLPEEGRAAAPYALAPLAEQGLIPAGITAWAADERRNALEVRGTGPAIGAFRHIIQLLDVPARQVRLSLRVLPLGAAGLRGLTVTPGPRGMPGWPSSESAALVTKDQLVALEREEVLGSSVPIVLTVTGNHPVHLRWGQGPGQPAIPATVLPRVNDDGSVTLLISRLGLDAGGRKDGRFVLRHIPPTQGIVFLSRKLGTALVVDVREVLPAAPGL